MQFDVYFEGPQGCFQHLQASCHVNSEDEQAAIDMPTPATVQHFKHVLHDKALDVAFHAFAHWLDAVVLFTAPIAPAHREESKRA